MSFPTLLAGIKLENVLLNASGPLCTTLDELKWIQAGRTGWTVTKSCTLDPREWNPEPRYVDVPLGSINSMGLPNHGYKAYIEYTKELKKISNKPIIASIAGMCKDDFLIIVEAFQRESEADILEVNLSCPNVIWKPQIAYDFEAADEIIRKVCAIEWDKPLGLKLPPYFDPIHTQMMANVIKKHPKIRFITCINSVGNTLIIDPETESPLIKPKWWLGGLGGEYIKPVSLANVRSFYKLIWDQVQIIWCGGIYTWVDVFEHILCWASAVQLGTVYAQEWIWCFERIEREFNEYMNKKWYTSIDEIRGRLKEL